MATSPDANRTARIVRGGRKEEAESPRARAARSRLEAEGFTIEPFDVMHWRIADFSFWPAVNMWRDPAGRLGGGGLVGLIDALKAARKPPAGT